MAYGIRNIPDRMKALREVYRVLKPGGTFACLEFSTPPNAVWRFLYHIYLKVMIPFWGQVFTHDRQASYTWPTRFARSPTRNTTPKCCAMQDSAM